MNNILKYILITGVIIAFSIFAAHSQVGGSNPSNFENGVKLGTQPILTSTDSINVPNATGVISKIALSDLNLSQVNNDGNGLSPFITYNDIFTGNVLIEGGYYHLNNYNYFVWANKFIINGILHESSISDTVTLSASDPINDRIDLIVINNDDTISVITGVPSPNPLKPSSDQTTQLEVAFIIVKVGTTEDPTISNNLVYDEDLGAPGEWAKTFSSGTINSSSVIDASNGTKSIEFTSSVLGDYIAYQDASLNTNSGEDVLIFKIKYLNEPPGDGFSLRIWIKNSITGEAYSAWVNTIHSYGTDLTNFTDWQSISIDLLPVLFTLEKYDVIEFQNQRSGSNFRIDEVNFQTGISIEPPTGSITATSQLINDGEFGTSTYVENDALGLTATTNDYNDLDNKPVIGGSLEVKDEGISTVNPASILNFTGSAVTVTDAGAGEATINIVGGTGESTTVSDTPEIAMTLTGSDITSDLVVGSIDVLKLDAGVQTSLGLADTSIQEADVRTLTNKTINSDNNSISNIAIEDLNTDGQDLMGFANAIALDPPIITVTSNGTTVSLNLEQNGGGDIRFIFSDGVHIHDTTPVESITLTAGSDTSPQINYIYILQSNKTLTVSTTGFPATEHAPIATALVQSALSVQTDGAYKTHAWTDHATSSNDMGHLAHLNAWIRSQEASWISGVMTTTTTGIATFNVSTTSGVVRQLHEHTFHATATPTDPVFVVNDNTVAYRRVTNPTSILTDASGVSMSNTRFNVVIWGSVNEAAADCKVFWNLPTNTYSKDQDAIDDIDGTTIYTMPSDYTGTGFLIARLTVRHVSSTNTWSILQNESLLGKTPSHSAGGGSSGFVTEFSDNVFKIFNNADNTKEILFNASAITTATARTISMPDVNVDLGDIAINNAKISYTDAVAVGLNTAKVTESTTVSDTPELNLTLTGFDVTGEIVASSIDETKLDVSTNASLDLADTALQSFTEVDGSVTNELQTIANTSDATSHTATLSDSGGSFKLVEGSGITIATTGTGLDGIATITASGGGGGTVTNVSSATTNQLTVATPTDTPVLTIVTGAVADLATALATGDQIYDFVIGQNYSVGLHFTPSNLLTDYSFTDNSTDWNLAHGWGDHSLEGYITAAANGLDDVLGNNNKAIGKTALFRHTGDTYPETTINQYGLEYSQGTTAGTKRVFINSNGLQLLENGGTYSKLLYNDKIDFTRVGFGTLSLRHDNVPGNITVQMPNAGGTIALLSDIGGTGATQLSELSDVVSATNTNRFSLMANGTTGYVGRALVEADISDFGTYNNYVHPTGDGNSHVPANSTTNNGKVLTAGATAGLYTWETIPAGVTDHTLLSNIGTNTHAQIDTHIADATVHFTEASISITESQISDLTHAVNTDDQTASEVLMTGYVKPGATSAILATDNVDDAIGKLEKGLEDATSGGVTSVAGKTGIVVLVEADITDLAHTVNTNLDIASVVEIDTGTDNAKAISSLGLAGSQLQTDVTANNAKVSDVNHNVSTNLNLGTITATTIDVNSSDGTNATLLEANTTQAGILGSDKWDEIVANSLKVSDINHNVTTNLSEGTSTTTTVDINSSDGTNATLLSASTTRAGVLSKAKFDEIVVNTAKDLSLYKEKIIATTAQGGNTTENGVNTWSKLATYNIPIDAKDSNFIYALGVKNQGNSGSTILNVFVRRTLLNDLGGTTVNIISSSNDIFIGADSFKLVYTDATDLELWVQKKMNWGTITVSLINESTTGNYATYYNNSAWQSAEPIGGGGNIRTSGVLSAMNNTVEGTVESTGFKVTTKSDLDVVLAGGGTTLLSGIGGASPLTTKGDVYTYSTADARIGVGTNGQVLTADSAEATGLKWTTVAGTGDMILANAQTNTGIKTFNNTTLKLRNVANTFDGYFVNTNTADRIYTLQDGAGIVAFTSDITGTNSGTNTGDESITDNQIVVGTGTGIEGDSKFTFDGTKIDFYNPSVSVGGELNLGDNVLDRLKIIAAPSGGQNDLSTVRFSTSSQSATANAGAFYFDVDDVNSKLVINDNGIIVSGEMTIGSLAINGTTVDGRNVSVDGDKLDLITGTNTGDNAVNSLYSGLFNPTGLEQLTETTTGWRLIGQAPANYGNIGTGAIDFSDSSGASATRGATGSYSLAGGQDVINNAWGGVVWGFGIDLKVASTTGGGFGSDHSIDGYGSFSFNRNNDIIGDYNFGAGRDNTLTGDYNSTIGATNVLTGDYGGAFSDNSTISGNFGKTLGTNLYSRALGEIAVGHYNTTYTATQPTTGFDVLDRVFSIGIGSSGATANGMVMLNTGELSLPKYGVNTFTGTAAYNLSVDASGNIIETANPSGTSPLTTKGDVFTYSTVDARLGVGTNGQVLTVDIAETTGLKWTTPAGGGNVSAVNTPVLNDFARFTTATDIEGRSYAETRTDLGLVVGTDVQAFSTVLNNTTASFLLADETKLDGISANATVDQTSIVGITGTKAQFNTELSDGDFKFVGDAPTIHTHDIEDVTNYKESKSITIESPTATEDISLFYSSLDIEITKIITVTRGTTPSLTWTIRYGADRSTAGTEVVTGGSTTTNTTTGHTITTFNNSTVGTNSFIWLETSAQTGTVDEVNITIYYTIVDLRGA